MKLLTSMFLCAVCLLAMSCAVSSNELSVSVRTDLLAFEEFQSVLVEVDEAERVAAVRASEDYFAGARVYDGSHEKGIRLVTVTLLDRDVPVVSRKVAVLLDADKAVTVVLTRSCKDVVCDDTTSCLAGECVPLECTAETPSECPVLSSCTASCSAGVCGEASCHLGVCFKLGNSGCDVGLYCDPDVGCQPSRNGGDVDGGMDAEVDAGILDMSVVPDGSLLDADDTPDTSADATQDAVVAGDATLDATPDAEIPRACENPADEAALRPVTVQSAIGVGAGCAQSFPNDRQALVSCIAGMTPPLTSMCLGCFADIALCVTTMCGARCSAPQSPDCSTCRQDMGCNDQFFDCSGVSAVDN